MCKPFDRKVCISPIVTSKNSQNLDSYVPFHLSVREIKSIWSFIEDELFVKTIWVTERIWHGGFLVYVIELNTWKQIGKDIRHFMYSSWPSEPHLLKRTCIGHSVLSFVGKKLHKESVE